MATPAEHLLALGPDALAALLERRPDVLAPPSPRDLTELTARLHEPASVAQVLRSADTPTLQVTEALAALGGDATAAHVAALLDHGHAHLAAHLEAVERCLAWLAERAVVRPHEDGVTASPALAVLLPVPLGLGTSIAALLPDQTVALLRSMLDALGVPVPAAQGRPPRKEHLVRALREVFEDADRLRAVVAAAPPAVRQWLERTATQPADPLDPLESFGGHAPVGGAYRDPYRQDAASWRREQEAVRWAGRRGLVVGLGYGSGVVMPGEVALALRGPAWGAPFTPQPPAVPALPVPEAAVQRESAAAATAFVAAATAVLDAAARDGVAALKSGAVGARELKRLVGAGGGDETTVRLVLELADDADLVRRDADTWRGTGELATWRSGEPADRYALLVATWWRLGRVPTVARDEDGKVVPALAPRSGRGDCADCAAGRAALLAELARQPSGTGAELPALAAAALWRRPVVHATQVGDAVPFAATWREAELLGLVALGALTDTGWAATGGDAAAVAERAAAVLPASSSEATFGADLTAVVPGSPSARVTQLLDACADREGRGGAVVWRLSPGSVRRALDAGTSGAQLLTQLEAIARGALPQPLHYLVEDVARRHGSLRVRPVTTVVRSHDEALLAQVAVDRVLRRLALRALAPTVLASDAPAEQVLTALRSAGYLPLVEDAEGAVVLARPAPGPVAAPVPRGPGRPSSPRADADAPRDPREAAAALWHAGVGAPRGQATGTAAVLASLANRLPPPQRTLLARAIDEGEDVVIRYVSASGGETERRIGDAVLVGSVVHAWCHLRQDERMFAVSRIQAVRAAP